MPPDARPPATDPLVALADRCVRCGLCLPACPTYGRDRLEAESPRGRIALARAWQFGTIDVTPIGEAHLDHCLGCRSCEAACPAGVQYGELLTIARLRQRQRRAPQWRQRAIEALAARPRWLARLLALYRLVFHGLPARWRPLPRPPRRPTDRTVRARDRSEARSAQTAALFIGCVADPYEAPLRAAVRTLLDGLGIAVLEPTTQTCCGSLHAHAGDAARAAELTARNRDAFAGTDLVLSLASGCHESVAQALAGQARVVDAISFLAEHADALHLRECRERIALHLPCSQRNVVKSVPALRRLLARVPGLQVIELDAGYGCCGAAGTQMLTDRERADDYRHPLIEQLAASGATRLLSANIGCRLHLAGAATVPIEHPLDFIARLAAPRPPDTASTATP